MFRGTMFLNSRDTYNSELRKPQRIFFCQLGQFFKASDLNLTKIVNSIIFEDKFARIKMILFTINCVAIMKFSIWMFLF